jgi:hypothetical protein
MARKRKPRKKIRRCSTRRIIMNIKKLRSAVDKLKEDLGDGLVTTDIWMVADGQSICGYNPQPKATALFNQVTTFLTKSLKTSNFPALGKFYIIDLTDNKMVMVIPMEDYQWGMMVDTRSVQMGLLLNVILPDIVLKFKEALAQ